MARNSDTIEESYEISYKIRLQVLEQQEYICPICGDEIIGRCRIHHVKNRSKGLDNDLSNLVARHWTCENYAHTVGRTGNPERWRIMNGLLTNDEDMDESRELRYPYGYFGPKRKDVVKTRIKRLSKGRHQNGYKDPESIDFSRKGIVTNQRLVKAITEDFYYNEWRNLQMQG